MATVEILQNELIRDILDIDNIDILKKIRKLLRKEKQTLLQPPWPKTKNPIYRKPKYLPTSTKPAKS